MQRPYYLPPPPSPIPTKHATPAKSPKSHKSPRRPKSEWDDTVHDLSVMKSTPIEREKRRVAVLSVVREKIHTKKEPTLHSHDTQAAPDVIKNQESLRELVETHVRNLEGSGRSRHEYSTDQTNKSEKASSPQTSITPKRTIIKARLQEIPDQKTPPVNHTTPSKLTPTRMPERSPAQSSPNKENRSPLKMRPLRSAKPSTSPLIAFEDEFRAFKLQHPTRPSKPPKRKPLEVKDDELQGESNLNHSSKVNGQIRVIENAKALKAVKSLQGVITDALRNGNESDFSSDESNEDKTGLPVLASNASTAQVLTHGMQLLSAYIKKDSMRSASMSHLLSELSSEVCTLSDRVKHVESSLEKLELSTTEAAETSREQHSAVKDLVSSLRADMSALQDVVKSSQLKDIADALLSVDIFEE